MNELVPEFLIFSLESICFLLFSNLFLIKNWLYSDRCWCDFSNEIFIIYKITELKKYFENTAKKQPNIINFSPKIFFYVKYYFLD